MISVVIPVRKGGSPHIALESLAGQLEGCEVVIATDGLEAGANWARNRGFARSRGEFLLFSDDDIEWLPGAVEILAKTLDRSPAAAYAYGSYVLKDPAGISGNMAGQVQCNVAFSASRLRDANFVSTMSLIRREAFPGFDESIHRLQDWDLWLTMLQSGHTGIYCGSMIFTTAIRPGITYGGGTDYKLSRRIVAEKHRLRLSH